jgi:hypothetical protein
MTRPDTRKRPPAPTEAEIQKEIDLALTREGLIICRALAKERIKWTKRKAEA